MYFTNIHITEYQHSLESTLLRKKLHCSTQSHFFSVLPTAMVHKYGVFIISLQPCLYIKVHLTSFLAGCQAEVALSPQEDPSSHTWLIAFLDLPERVSDASFLVVNQSGSSRIISLLITSQSIYQYMTRECYPVYSLIQFTLRGEDSISYIH